MRWVDHLLSRVLPARCYAKIHSGRVDAAFDQASAARNRKVAATDETITANIWHRQRVEGAAAAIRARTEEQEAKWPSGRTDKIRILVDHMLNGTEDDRRGRKGDRS